MRWRRGRKRWTLLLALGLVAAAVGWVITHPDLLTPYFARLATRHLLRDSDGDLKIGAFSGNMLTGIQLYDVTLSLRGERGAAIDVGVDTLSVDYSFGELLKSPLRLRRVGVSGAVCLARRGDALPADVPVEPGVPFKLPRFRVDDLQIVRSSATVSGPQGRIEEEVRDITWRGTVKADTALALVCRTGDLDWVSRSSRFEDLHGLLTVNHDRLVTEQLTGQLNGHDVAVSGHRRHVGDLQLQITAEQTSTSEIEELIDMALGFKAAGGARLGLASRADSLWLDISFRGDLEGYQMDGLHGRCMLVDDSLDWDHLEGRINGAWFSGTGTFDVSDPDDVTFQLRGDVADVDLAQGLVPDVVLPETDGWGWLNLWRRDSTNQTRVSGWLREGHIEAVPFDSVSVSVEADNAGVTFHALELHHADQTAHLTGYADTSGAFLGRVEIDARDLSTLPGEWPSPPLTGSLQASGTVTGQDPVYDFQGVAAIASLELGPIRADSCRTDLTVEDILGSPKVSAEVAGRSLICAGARLGAFTTGGVVTSEAAILHHFRAQNGDTTLAFRAQADFDSTGADYYLPQLEFILEGNSWRLEDPARFSTGAGYFNLEPASLASDYGSLSAFGVWDEDGDNLEGEIVLEHFDLDLVNSFRSGEDHLNGDLSAVLSLGGTPYEPLLGIEARLSSCELPLAVIDSLTVGALFYDDILDIRRLDLHSDHGRVEASGQLVNRGVDPEEFWTGAALDLHLDVTDGDWAFIDQFALPSLDRIAGTFDGSLDVGGTTFEPEIEGGIVSTPFHVHWVHLDELAGSVSYDDGQLTLADLQGRKENLFLTGRLEIPLELDFHSEPVSPLDGPLYMRFNIPPDSDLAALARMCNAFVETGGRGGLDLVISGKAEHPYYSGSVDIADGSCVIRALNEVYRDVYCTGLWQGDVLTISDIRGREGERGTLAGDGTLTFNGLILERFDIALAVDRFLVASIPELRALVRSDAVALTSVKVGPDSLLVPKFTGDLEVIEARYVGDFSEQPSLSDPRVGTVAPDWLADLNLRAPRNSGRVVNRTMELDLGGDVRLVRDLDGMYLRGSMAIDRGHLPVFNNDFKVTRGTLDFSQEVGVIPMIDMTAETSVRLPAASEGGTRPLEKIYVDVTGSAITPLVRFRSESGYARSNIERMLLGLSPHATDSQTNSAIRQGTMAAGFNLLEREVAAELDLVDTFDIESGRVREDGTTQTLIGVGKYIGRDLYVKFAQAITDQDREVVVEYQITNHLLLQSEISRRLDEALGNTTYSVDLKYRFEY